MNLNEEKYKDFIKAIKANKQENHVCEFLEDEYGLVSCQKSTFCNNIERMLNGDYYDCEF